MRTSFWILVMMMSSPAAAFADPPIRTIEARLGAGLAGGGGADATAWRVAPMYVGAYGNVAIATTPWTWMHGGVFVESGDRAAVGGSLGPRVLLGDWQAGATVNAIVAPYTLYGVAGHLGRRIPIGRQAVLVPTIELVTYLAGDDLPADHVALQLLLAIGVELDAP